MPPTLQFKIPRRLLLFFDTALSRLYLTKGQGVASGAGDGGLDVLAAEQRVLVWDAGHVTLRSAVLALAKVDVVGDGVAVLVAVNGLDGVVEVGEDSALNEDLGAHAGVDTGLDTVVVGVVDVGGTEADRLHGVSILLK